MVQDAHAKLHPGLPRQKQHLTRRRNVHQEIALKFKEEASEVLLLERGFVWCCNWTLREVGQNYLERSEMWCWIKGEKIIWTDRVRNEKAL